MKVIYRKVFCKRCEKTTQHELTIIFEDNSQINYRSKCLVNLCKRISSFTQYKLTKFTKVIKE